MMRTFPIMKNCNHHDAPTAAPVNPFVPTDAPVDRGAALGCGILAFIFIALAVGIGIGLLIG